MNKTLVCSQIVALSIVLNPSLAVAKKISGRAPQSIIKTDPQLSLSEIQRDFRLQHAHELLGKYYKTSAVRAGETVQKINSKIYAWAHERLPKKFKSQYKEIAQAIIDESLKHEFDPVFVLSVIQNESSFNPSRLGALDEIGLMQLRPGTAEWIAGKFNLKYSGKNILHDPIENIRIGTAYMAYLRDKFDSHAQLYISAYNMGKRNVDGNLEKNIWPREYASHVMRYYVDFYTALKIENKKKSQQI